MTRYESAGFEGVLSGTTIQDLIQMSCIALATRAVHVEAQRREGIIYLGGGQIVHAETDRARGEEALFEILTWSHGRFGIEEGRVPTITRMWQSLLLEAAHHLDESRRPRDPEGGPEPMEPSNPPGPLDGSEVTSWIRFGLKGGASSGRGADLEEQQACWAYAIELSQALGQTLGLEALASIETRGPAGRAFCHLSKEGALAVVGAPGVDTTPLLERAARGEL
jgi:hypothetical protein